MKSHHLPKISIIIPSYNQGHFIRETIQSILSQGDPSTQVFVFDGGSQDETLKVLKSFGRAISWISERDKGQTDALNKGLKHLLASDLDEGDIIAYINSDDYYLPGAFAKVRTSFQSHSEAGWIVGDAQIVNEHGKRIQEPIRWYKRFFRWCYSGFLIQILNPIPQPSVFIKFSAVKKVGLFNPNLHFTMDYEYWLRLQRNVGKPFFCSNELSAFRIHGTSKGTTQYSKQFEEGLQVVSQFTKNHLVRSLHHLHNQLILLIYKIIK